MKDTKSNEIISAIEGALCCLEEDCEALLCLYDGLENEGHRHGSSHAHVSVGYECYSQGS